MALADSSGETAPIRVPARATFAALVVGLVSGWALAGRPAEQGVLAVAGPIGSLWLRGLQMTIVPLVVALLVIGVIRLVETARAGPMARHTLTIIVAVLAGGTLLAAFATPALLQAFPIPGTASAALVVADESGSQEVPGLGAFFESLIAPNIFAAAAATAMVPLLVFFAAFAVAVTRLADPYRGMMAGFFEALARVMLTIVGWVLWLAPVGVFALAVGVAARGGGETFAALVHYVLLVSSLGLAILCVAYGVAILGGRLAPGRFARAVLPAQIVALSTQSSLASLPAMLAACRALGLRETTADFVLPLAVTVFRATSPAMNLGVAIYVAHLVGIELTAAIIATGAAVAMVTTIGSVSLPGTVSFVASIGPIALAMGVPVEPLALLIAVEMLPDIVRTIGNVTMNVAVTATVDRTTST